MANDYICCHLNTYVLELRMGELPRRFALLEFNKGEINVMKEFFKDRFRVINIALILLLLILMLFAPAFNRAYKSVLTEKVEYSYQSYISQIDLVFVILITAIILTFLKQSKFSCITIILCTVLIIVAPFIAQATSASNVVKGILPFTYVIIVVSLLPVIFSIIILKKDYAHTRKHSSVSFSNRLSD